MSKQKTIGCLVHLVRKCYPSACIICFWRYVIIVHLELYWCLIYWQWRKIVVRKAWVTSVAFTDWKRTVEKNCCQESMGHKCGLYLYRKKNCSQESMGHECHLDLYEKKLFSRKHGSWLQPSPLPTENGQCKRLFSQKHVCKFRWIVRPSKIHVEDHI
jgi:hypothetical protein